MGGNSPSHFAPGQEEEGGVTFVKGIRLSDRVINRMRQSSKIVAPSPSESREDQSAKPETPLSVQDLLPLLTPPPSQDIPAAAPTLTDTAPPPVKLVPPPPVKFHSLPPLTVDPKVSPITEPVPPETQAPSAGPIPTPPSVVEPNVEHAPPPEHLSHPSPPPPPPVLDLAPPPPTASESESQTMSLLAEPVSEPITLKVTAEAVPPPPPVELETSIVPVSTEPVILAPPVQPVVSAPPPEPTPVEPVILAPPPEPTPVEPVILAPPPEPTPVEPVILAPPPEPTPVEPVILAPPPEPTPIEPVILAPPPEPTVVEPVILAPPPEPTPVEPVILAPPPEPTPVEPGILAPVKTLEAALPSCAEPVSETIVPSFAVEEVAPGSPPALESPCSELALPEHLSKPAPPLEGALVTAEVTGEAHAEAPESSTPSEQPFDFLVPPTVVEAPVITTEPPSAPAAPVPPEVVEEELRQKIKAELQLSLEEEISQRRQALQRQLEELRAVTIAEAEAAAQAQVEEQVKKTLEAEKAAYMENLTQSLTKERMKTEDEKLMVQLYWMELKAHKLELREEELKKRDALYKEHIKKLESKCAQFYKVTADSFQKSKEETLTRFARVNIQPVCGDLQSQIMKCYQEYPGKTLSCSGIASAYMQCVNQAKVNKMSTRG